MRADANTRTVDLSAIRDNVRATRAAVPAGTGILAVVKADAYGHGCVPVTQCLRTLKRNGYDGFVSIEFEGCEDNEWAIQTGLDNLRRYAE